MTDHPGDLCVCNRPRLEHPAPPPCTGFRKVTCHDCPDLDNDAERPPAPWRPRPVCCRDEHLDRRMAGDPRDWEGVDRARATSDREAAAGTTAPRQQHRADKRRRAKRARGRSTGESA